MHIFKLHLHDGNAQSVTGRERLEFLQTLVLDLLLIDGEPAVDARQDEVLLL